jgi:hypothetical protein
MRRFLLALCILPAPAAADECKLPYPRNKELMGVTEFADCIQKRVKVLETENAKLRKDLDDMRKSLVNFPGEVINENGRETRLGGDRIARASYSLTSRSREARTGLAIDAKLMDELCSTDCTVTLLAVGERLRDTPGKSEALGPCTFRYNGRSGAWSFGGCVEPISGVDGDGTPSAATGGDIIATVGEACLLADAEPSRALDQGGGILGRDRGKGLYLIADPSLWQGDEDRFRCELKFSG